MMQALSRTIDSKLAEHDRNLMVNYHHIDYA